MVDEHFLPNQAVYVHLKGRGWATAKAVSVDTKGKKLDAIPDTPPTDKVTLPFDQCHIIIPGSYDVNDDDLFRVGDLHTATLLHCLKDRVEEGKKQYSKMGEMVLSVNPFAPMGFNSESERAKYLDARDPFALPPHVWQIAEKAYLAVVARHQNHQSVVISGESGSGKTENTKTLIAYLGELSAKHSCNAMQKGIVERVNEALYQSNPVLESFGNARTVRNDNSSRFGKYIKLFFDPTSGIMIGGEMITYLLEKSRIVRVCEGERAYHIFYEMLAGLSAEEKQKLGGLKTARDYPSLAAGNTFTRRGVDGRELDDKVEFQKVVKALETVGFTPGQREAVWAVLAAVLHLQELKFKPDSNEKAEIADDGPLKRACEQLGVDPEAMKPCLLVKSKTKILTSLCTPPEAEALRDSMCKALYLGLFDSVVEKVNRAIAPTVSTASAKYIGILDIFGFENFKVNSFEQICINFANESLQNHYNKFTFVNDEAECKEEGIQVPDITFPDNTKCLQLFDTARTGIFAMLDEQCYVRGGTAGRFTELLWQQWEKNSEHFIKPKSTAPTNFGVHHYASDVNYTTEGWLEKNSDPLKEETRDALQKSTHAEADFVGHLLDKSDATPSDGQSRKRVSVASKFQTQLLSLRGELESTETHFIRCIKPNMQAKPALVENDHVTSQLESAGVLQTIELKRQGYPVRRKLQDFATFFHSIAPPKTVMPLLKNEQFREAADLVLKLYDKVFGFPGGKYYATGKTKVFLKAEMWNVLERTLLRRNKMRMRRVGPHLRKWMRLWKLAKDEREAREREEQMAKMKAAAEARASAGLASPDKVKTFEETCAVFPQMDPTLIFDVVLQLDGDQSRAVAALSEMRAQEYDKYLPANFLNFMRRQEIPNACIQQLTSNGIDTLGALYTLTPEAFDAFGFTEEQKQRIMEAIVAQESHAMQNERLLVSGTGAIRPSDEEILDLGDAAMRVKRNDQIDHLMEVLGCTKEKAEEALREAGGNPTRAAAIIVDGSAGRTRRRSSGGAAAGGASAPRAAAAPAPTSRAAAGLDAQWQQALRKLLDIGIDEARALSALRQANGNPQRAIDFVFAA